MDSVAVPASAPVPVNGTACGLPAASSATVSAAERAPVAPGVNFTVNVQLADAARVARQVLVCVKSARFVPVMEIPAIFKIALPVFVSVTVCPAL